MYTFLTDFGILYPYFINRDVCLDQVLSFVTAHYSCKGFRGQNVNDAFQEGKSVHRNVKVFHNKRRLREIY